MAATEETATEGADESYPAGPITCCVQCLSKDVRIRQGITTTASLLIAWMTSVVAVALFITAFSTVAWASVLMTDGDSTIVRSIGLWRECHSDTGCFQTDLGINGAGMKASQGVAVVCLLAIIIECGLTTLYTFFPDVTDPRVGMIALWTKVACFLSILVLLPVFAQTWYKPKYTSMSRSLEYSFILAVITFVLEGLSMFFMYCHVIVFKSKHKRLVEAKIVEDYPGEVNQGFADGNNTGAFPGGEGIPPNHPEKSESLAQEIQGQMNAKSAYEHFTSDPPVIQQQLRHPNSIHNVPADSEFASKEDIGKRFAGLTLAEPEYASIYGSYSTLATVQDLECAPDSPHLSRMRHDAIDASPALVHRMRDTHLTNKPTTASMQNIYNETKSLQLQRDQTGKFITSVSMYNLADEIAAGEKGKSGHDKFSMRSWHPERPAMTVFNPDQSLGGDSRSGRVMHPDHRGSVQDVRRLSSQQQSPRLPSYPSQATLTHVSTHSLHAAVTDTKELIARPKEDGSMSPRRSSNEDVRPKQRRNSGRRKKTKRQTQQSGDPNPTYENRAYADDSAIPMTYTNPASIRNRADEGMVDPAASRLNSPNISETALNGSDHIPPDRLVQRPNEVTIPRDGLGLGHPTPNMDRQPPEGQSRELDKPFPSDMAQQHYANIQQSETGDSQSAAGLADQTRNRADRLSPEGQTSEARHHNMESGKNDASVRQISREPGRERRYDRKHQPETAIVAPSRRRRDKLQQNTRSSTGGPAPLTRARSTPEINMTSDIPDKGTPAVTSTNMTRGKSMNALNLGGDMARARSTTSLHSIGATSMVSGCAETEI